MSARMFFRLALAGAVLVAASGCGDGPAASVDGTEITRATFDKELEVLRLNTAYIARREQKPGTHIADETGRLTDSFVAEVLTNNVNSVVMRQEVKRRRLSTSAADREWARDYAPVSAGNPRIFSTFPRWFQEVLLQRATVVSALHRSLKTKDSPEEYYESHKADFVKSCARHILVRTQQEAQQARERISAGEDFASVARDVSIDSGTRPKGGDIGCNGRGDLNPQLDRAAFSQRIGDVGPPVETPEGFNLVLVSSRGTPPFARISGEIEVAIHSAGTEALGDLVHRRLREAEVRVSPRYGRWNPRRLAVMAR